MVHSEAKFVLARALDSADRKAAVAKAIQMGMSLTDVEEYLDWLDASRAQVPVKTSWARNFIAVVARFFRRPSSHKSPAHSGKSTAIPH